MRAIRWSLVCLLSVWPLSSALAGPWTLPRNHFYLQVGTSFSVDSGRFDPDGKLIPLQVQKTKTDVFTLNDSNLQQLLSDFYFEYGLIDSLTIFGDLPFLNSMRQLNKGGNIQYSATNVGDLMLGGRIGILLDPLVFALEARLTFPTGDVSALIPTGQGDFRGELRLVAGKAFRRIPLDISGELGFTERGNTKFHSKLTDADEIINFSPELYLRIDLALNLAIQRVGLHRLLLDVAADYRTSTQGATVGTGTFSLIPPVSRLATVSVGGMWFFNKYFGLNLRIQQGVAGAALPRLTSVGGSLFATY
jgi:hypothetical protein